MTILGAVFLDRPVVESLTTAFCVGDEIALSSELSHLARVLDTLSKAQITLEEFYGNIQAPIRNPGRFFPYTTHYKNSDGQRIEFTYLKALSEDYPDADKLVFLAGTGPAHTLLAERQLAPKLLYDGTVHPQDQPRPDHAMIVMEFLHGVDLGKFTDYPLPDSVPGDIDNALKYLHDKGFVFGDLRDPNVMIETNTNGTVIGAKLIDFDWCGVHQEGRFPDSMNQYINWAEGAEPRALMDKRHDTEMRKKLNLWM
ncbi:kinase domain protein [Ceratobasidium sp. AG-Ba]|nr:kinase domain protein [Ceratobasidium sp. AG-Ba]